MSAAGAKDGVRSMPISDSYTWSEAECVEDVPQESPRVEHAALEPPNKEPRVPHADEFFQPDYTFRLRLHV
jgi:hypothetical protein